MGLEILGRTGREGIIFIFKNYFKKNEIIDPGTVPGRGSRPGGEGCAARFRLASVGARSARPHRRRRTVRVLVGSGRDVNILSFSCVSFEYIK